MSGFFSYQRGQSGDSASLRHFRQAVFASLGVFMGASACTAVVAPNDTVERCNKREDCPTIEDTRYVSACRFDEENAGLDSILVDKICVAEFATVSCANPQEPAEGQVSPFWDVFSAWAQGPSANYGNCFGGNVGILGCPPASNGSCGAGLVVNVYGVCDDNDPATPPAARIDPTSNNSNAERDRGKDVRDQFCRSYFCDENFVCDAGGTCKVCDPEDSRFVDGGGCGQVYVNGQVSPVYQSAAELKTSCPGAVAAPENVKFGDLPP